MADPIVIAPQAGPQEQFINCDADIVIYGGAAGGGKSHGLLLDALKYADPTVPLSGFNAVIFRRTFAQIEQQGGIWDKTTDIYPLFAAKPNLKTFTWVFPNKIKIGFAHLQHEKNKLNYQGAEIPYIGFDELTHFTETQFFYLLSRNRSTTGQKGKIRCTTNPDPDSWVKKLIRWWLDDNGEYTDPDKSGIIRWFVRIDNTIHWFDTEQAAIDAHPDSLPLSFTFIGAKLDDNQKLMQADPGYRARLRALPLVERLQLEHGNWKVKHSAGNIFKRQWFKIAYRLPHDIAHVIRYWDRAATEKTKANKDPDATAGVLMGKTKKGEYIIIDVCLLHGTPGTVKETIKRTAEQDQANFGNKYTIGLEKDPGQAGVYEIDDYIKYLTGYIVKIFPARQNKVTRAGPFASACENGLVSLLQAGWNDSYLDELEMFPDGPHDDRVDASSGAFNLLTSKVDNFSVWV